MYVGFREQWLTALVLLTFLGASLVSTADAQKAPEAQVDYVGWVDICTRTRVAGWALRNGQGTPVDVLVNGKKIMTMTPNVRRTDLIRSGGAPDSGFDYALPTPVGPREKLQIVFANGRDLGNSPCK